MSELASPTVLEALRELGAGRVSARELAEACLERVAAADGRHSHEGDPGSVNAWVRTYPERAAVDAGRADADRAGHGTGAPVPPLCGVPLGLKDVIGVAGMPLTASSRVLDVVPKADSAAWSRLSGCGAVLLGHTHTHEMALGSSTDQVANPWAMERSAGGSSGGSAAAVAAAMVPAAIGTDTSGSLRIPSALCGTSALKPTRGAVPLDGVDPSSLSRDHAGPIARTLADCAVVHAALATPTPDAAATALRAQLGSPEPGASGAPRPLEGMRFAISPRAGAPIVAPEVGRLFEEALEAILRLGGEVARIEPPEGAFEATEDLVIARRAETLALHDRFRESWDRYRPSVREVVVDSDRNRPPAFRYVQAQRARGLLAARWRRWFAARRVDAIVEPTVPILAPARGRGYERFFTEQEQALAAFTRYWSWTGMPVAAIPCGLAGPARLPVGLSLIGDLEADWRLLAIGIELQAELGVPTMEPAEAVEPPA